jgi:Tfp pilus assembly protein PilE
MKNTKRLRIIVCIAILGIAVLGSASYLSYKYGLKKGQKDEAAKHSSNQKLDDTFKNANSLFSRYINGKIKSVEGSQVTIETKSGNIEKVTLTDKTTYTLATKKATKDDVKNGQQATVLVSETDKNQAVRVSLK